ncbi:ADP-ribosylarginine hydrolase CG2909 isoform X2 [Calliopsis andreniformis]|uniref:ADP-ribosylarginine hydrolase CG2909 isoform X2 n=1 Tax=Calliopsis andreniformis TaxID=337506 RepID=UPI003FCE76D4
MQSQRRMEEARQQQLLKEAPEISWENTLGSPNGVPFDDETKELLKKCLDVSAPAPTTLAQIIKRSEAFPIKFPINTVRCSALRDRGVSTEILEMNANSVYPLIHEAMLPLVARWLNHKRMHGSAIERAMYLDMGLIQFIHRLLEKRAVCFYGPMDRWKLIDGKAGVDGWENVGTDNEKEPLVLTKCLSYDEIKLSAMLAMSSHTEFINDGSRKNRGVVTTDPDSIEPRGVIIGVVGTRFGRPHFMEYQDILITPLQNTVENGYGPPPSGELEGKHDMRVLWAKFYGEEYHPLYEETVKRVRSKDNNRYLSLTNQTIFDIENYMRRTLLTVEIILLEANTRAEKQNTTAFLHVVGFGLGVWKIIQNQEIYFLKTFEIAIKKMNKKLKYVSDIMFAYFNQQKCGDVGNGDYLGDIKIHFALREPHSKLFRAIDANKLLVVTYAWDGNALPGNEFWNGSLSSSGDPAAACSSQVAELHTARINPRTCGSSLHVASAEHGILHISDYAKLHLA